MSEEIVIPRRFRGPSDSANGGYTCGLLARALGANSCTVTLRRPAPLDTPLEVQRYDDSIELLLRGQPIASAEPASLELDLPAPPKLDLARAASRRFTGFRQHPQPGCFVCGPQRKVHDGLRIFAGRLPGSDAVMAAPWQPDDGIADENGYVRSPYLWAALDCPGYFAVEAEAGVATLGSMTGDLRMELPANRHVIVLSWPLDAEAEHPVSASALFTDTGELVACARSVWIPQDLDSAA